MHYRLRRHSFRMASVALLVALAGCASQNPTISNDTRAKLAQALQDSGDTANAAIVRDQATRTAGQPPDPLTHASALIAAGQLDQGMSEAKGALAAHGDDLPAALEVGRLALRSGRVQEAGDVYQQLLLHHPDSVEALNGKGVVLAQEGDLNGAADVLRRALALRPRDVPTRNNLALVMLLSGEAHVALSMLEDLDRSDGSPQVKATLALARAKSRTQGAAQPASRQEVAPLVIPPALVFSTPKPATWGVASAGHAQARMPAPHKPSPAAANHATRAAGHEAVTKPRGSRTVARRDLPPNPDKPSDGNLPAPKPEAAVSEAVDKAAPQ